MKKLIIGVLCFAAVLAALPAFAATKTVTWSLPTDWEGNVELDQICEPVGAPSVAYYNALIEVPASATNFVITASDVAYRASELARPAPALEPSVVGEPPNAPVEDAALYASVYPSDVFEKGEPWEADGKTVLPVRIKVYRWNGPANKVEALESLKLSIACESPRAALRLKTSGANDVTAKYIVISPHNFVEYWQEFIDYRKSTHPDMTFALVDADVIYSEYPGKDEALKIHHFIEAMKAKGTEYVLLGAGQKKNDYAFDKNTMIPSRIVCIRGENTQICDYWYCVTDKKGGQEVWDYNGDGIYLASKNSSGGYTADATGKFSWVSTVKVFRFPARSSVTLGGKTKTAQQQIHGYVEKLRRFEQGLFAGRFSQAIIADTLGDQYDKSQGNTDASMTMEREFYDLGANIFSEVHGKSISQNEYETRERGYSYFTLKRPVGYNRSVLQHYYSNGENESMFLGRNFDAMLINSHGSPDLVEPIDRGEVFKASGLCGFYIMCVPCHAGNPGAGANNIVAISEASVLNPDGGSLVCFANSGFGWWGGKDTYSQKIERDVVRSLYGYSGSFQNAGAARMNAQNSYGTPSPGNSNGQVIANSMAYGDPLVALSPIWSRTVDASGNWRRGDQSSVSDQEFATGLTINATAGDQTITITNAVGAATLAINGTSGKTLTLAASGNGKFKVSNKVTVGNGMTLNWDVPGGFGRNGIQFTSGGNLRLRAEGYYGIEFQGMNSVTVAPPANKTAIVDFDSKGYFRDIKTGPISVNGPGETIFRSRQAGIFSTDFTVQVTGGTLTLETPCVGGSGSQSSTTPLFNVKNATLAIRPNPNWTPECFSRRVSFENGALNSRYDKFYLGANVSGYPGLDVTIDGPNNVFQGTSPIRLNGQLRIHSTTGGVVNVTGEMVNGNGTGSLKLDNKVTAKLAAVNTFSGGITVPSGARLVVDNVRGLGTGSVVVQSGGVLQMNAMPLAGVKSVTLQSGAKLVLKSTGSGSYQMYSPSQTSFTIADGVKVYDSEDEKTELDGIVTPEGAYFISDAAKYWGNISGGKWKNDSSVLAWKKKNVADNLAYADGDTVLFKNITGTSSTTVPVEGNVNPGMMAFQNTDTAYNFTGNGTITVGSMATAGTTSFAPAIKATSQVSIGGKTTVGNVTTPIINVAGGGALQVTGTANGIDTIRVIQMKITSTIGFQNATPREHAPEMSELRFYNKSGTQIIFPSGTVIKDSVGNTCTVSGGNTTSGHTFSQTSGSLYKLFDQNCGTYHMIGSNITGPWTITITCSQPIEVFGSFAYGRGQKRTSSNPIYAAVVGSYPDANPMQWTMSTGDAEASLKQVYSKNMGQDTAASSLTSQFGITWPSTSKATVQNGGTLYLSGTYNVPVTVNAGATLAVTNTSKATFSGGKTWPTGTYSMTVDTKDATKQAAWFRVTQNAGFSSTWQFQSDDETAIKLESGDLWVATAGVKAPPYSRTLSANGNWNTTDWVDGKTNKFDVAWGSATTKPTGSATLTVTGTNLTMSVDCGVNLDTLKVVTPTNCFPGTFTATGSSALGISALDFRDFNGKVIWNPPLASWGTHVYVGTNDVTIASMTSGKGNLQVGAGGRATVPEKFAGYDVDKDSLVRFTGTHSFAMGDIPGRGYLSFQNTTLSGSFQNSLIKYVVEKDDALTFTGDANNYNARMSSSFDIRGGSVTINSNGASTWFGINGETSFRQTNGTFRCTANDTSMSASNSGFLVGYSASSSDNFEFDISGGRFEIPNTYINFFGPVRFNLTSNGVVQAKGVYRGSNKGIITVNEGAAFELGTIGLVAGACDFNLYGGTLAGFENGAHTCSTVNLVGVGTLAAKANTTFTIDAGTINADGATLNIGNANYTGTVKLEDIPAGITNITVTAGTWDMGEFRPTNTVPVSVLTGKIAAQLTDAELRQAASDAGFKLIKTSLPEGPLDAGHVAVVTRSGTAVTAMGRVKDGYIYLSINYVYPLYGEVKVEGEQRWADIAWHDSIGMPFNGEWSAVTSAVLSNALADVTLVVTNAFTSELTVVNGGELELIREGRAASPVAAAIDDNASTGQTTIGFTANNVTAGVETVIKHVGSGTLTLAAGKCAALWNNLDWPSAKISGFSGTAKIKYVGNTAQSSIKYAGATNYGTHGVVSYAQEYNLSDVLRFDYTVAREFADGLNLTVERLMNGNQKNNSQTFYQTGGKILVTGSGDILGSSPTTTSPLLFSHWENPVTYYLTGGELIATNGVNGSVYFGRDGVPKLHIGGGSVQATLRTNGLINDSRTEKDKNGSVIELKPNGHLEIGDKGFVLYRNAELRLSGGTFLAYDNAEIKSDTSKFTLTDGTTSYLAAAAGKTLTVSKIPSGTGTIICQSGEGGTVLLKSGDWTNVTLGGKFTIQLTAAQRDSAVNTPLFKAAEGLTVANITLQNPDGSVASGKGILLDGKFQYVATDAYVMPIRATINGSSTWSALGWTDSSAEPRSVTAEYLSTKGASVVAELTAIADATVDCASATTVGTLTVTGSGRVSLSPNLAVNALKGDGTVVCSGFCRKYAGLNQSSWTGTLVLTNKSGCTGTDGYDFTDLGNIHSAVEVSGVTGWFNGCSACTETPFKGTVHNYTLRIGSGGLMLNNGNSNQGYCFARLEGAGALSVGAATEGPSMRVIALDVVSYTGALTVTGNAGVIIGTPSAVTGAGTISIDGVYGATFGTAKLSAVNGVTVRTGGFVNLLQTAESQTVWPIANTLTMSGGVMINGVAISSERYTVKDGTITLTASATGASMSLNIIGGAKDRPGLSIADGNYAGMVPVKGSAWNQAAQHTTTASFTEYANNLKEVLPNGTVYSGPMKATMSGNNTYTAGVTANNGHAQMMYGYIDDGGNGAKIIVENIPYTRYDVYVYPGGDHTTTSSSFRPVTVTVGNKTAVCPTPNTNWGNANSTHGTVTLLRGASGNFVKVEECAGPTLTVQGGTASGSVRGGIAAIQIFNTGTRLNTLTWNGGATGGTWDRTSANWKNGANADVAWSEVADGINTAAFNGDTSLTLGATVSPDVLDIRSNAVTSAETGYIPKGEGSKVLVASNMRLADVTSLSGEMWGGWVSSGGAATPYHVTRNGDTVTAQFQKVDGNPSYVKCVKVTFVQQGNDIYGYVNYAKNVSGSAIPQQFDSTGSETDVATEDGGKGYGIKKIKLSINSVGNLVVGGAEKFGKAFTVTNGVLTVATGALTQDVTIASGAKLNIITTDVTNEYVVTSGKVVNGTYNNILVNGEAIDQASWTLDLDHGKLVRVVQPGVPPFSYTISADSPSPVLWTNQQWLASNLFYVLPEEWTTGTVSEVKLTVDGNVTNTLVANANMTITKMSVLNSGVVEVTNGLVGGDILGAPFSLNITTLDDSASSGKTTLDFAPNSVTAGANTILSKSIAGKLTVNTGSKATFLGDAKATTYDIKSNGEVRFENATQSTSVASETEGAILSYKNAKFGMSGSKYWKLKLLEGDFVTATGSNYVNPIEVTGGELVMTNTANNGHLCLLYGGQNVQNKVHSSIVVTGGKVTVLASGTGTENTNCGFLFGTTANGDVIPSIVIDGGEFDVSGGRFTFWQKGTVTVANGTLKAKGIYKRDGSDSSLTVNQGGVVEVGANGISKADGKTLDIAFNGGTLRAIDNATNSVAIALGAESANTFSAANGKTQVVSGVLSGTGAFFAGEEGYAGTVKLTAQNTFTGNVGVRAGTLDIGGETLRGEVLVAEGATLAITRDGDWGEFTITSGGALNILGDVSLNGTVLERNGWTVQDGKLVVYKPDGTFYWIGSVNTEWNTRDANWKDGELSVAWEDGHYEGNSAAFTNSATITMSETVRPRAITVDNGQTLTISGPTHFGRAFDLTGALKLAPTSETLYDFEASGSGAITYEGGTITSLWRGTIPDGGLTIASGALSVTNGYFGSGLNVGTANVFGPTDATLVFDLGAEGAQVITGRSTEDARHYAIKVVSGTLKFTDGGSDSAFRGRTVAADGTNAVINLATGDATGWSVGGTAIALSNGGTLRVGSRDTLKTPLLFNGGTLELAKDCGGSGRGLDLYGNNNWAVTADSCVTYASGASDNDRKIALRNGDFTIAVEKDVTLTVEAVLAFNNNYGGTEGKLIKTGAGTLELSADNTYCKGTRIENGTLALDDGASAGTGAIEMSGGMLEFQLGTMTNDIHTTGGIINLVGELPTGKDEVAITTGVMTGEPQVRVNGEKISPSEWMVVGNKLKKVQHIAVSYGEPVTLAEGYEDKPVMFDVVDLAGGTVVINADRTLGSMAISGNGQLTLKFADEGKLTLVSGFVDPSVIIDATSLARKTLAKRSACGAPYSYWLICGEASAAERTVELPRMPSGYAVADQTVADLGLRLIVTAPDDARFGVISVNLRSGNALSVAGDHGLYPDDLANWGDLQTTAGKSVTVSNAVFTLGAEASGYYISNYTDEIYRQYLDDHGGVKRTVSIRNVPFDQYRIIVYFSTDNANAQFQPMSVNDGTTEVWYAGETQGETNANHTVIGKNTTWGHSGPNFGMNPIAEGVNMLVTDIYTGDVTLGFTRVGGPRATPCAIQVVKVGEMVIGEITDYTATVTGETVNFSAIEWEEGPFVDGTNHTVTITAPAGCTIVIDRDLTLYNFKVIAGENVTVKIAEDKTVSLAQGFLGEGYAIYADLNARLSTFSEGGSTGWTDTHDITFYSAMVDANGQSLCFTGDVSSDSYVTIYDGHAKPGCVTFGDNVSGIDGLVVNQGTVLLATTNQVTLGVLSTYGEGYKHLVMAAKTNEAAVRVTGDWEPVDLAGVTLDIDTFTEQPIPEDEVQYKLITAPYIEFDGATLGSSFKGSWKLEIVQDGDLKTLIAKKEKKGFYFIITKNEQSQETVVKHATDSKRALDIDRAWVVSNTTITSDQSQDDDKVTEAINVTGENGAKVWQSYVLGLEPKTATSKPVIAPIQTEAANKVAFRLDNIAVNPRAGANKVEYRVWSGDTPGKKGVASQVASYTDPIAVDLPTSGVRYYHIEVLID